MEYIVGVRVAPTSHVAHFKTAEKGLLSLVCVNFLLEDTTKERCHDDAMDLLATNCILEESLALLATYPRPPQNSFRNMKLCILKYAALT